MTKFIKRKDFWEEVSNGMQEELSEEEFISKEELYNILDEIKTLTTTIDGDYCSPERRYLIPIKELKRRLEE